jgi:hypothetical protein
VFEPQSGTDRRNRAKREPFSMILYFLLWGNKSTDDAVESNIAAAAETRAVGWQPLNLVLTVDLFFARFCLARSGRVILEQKSSKAKETQNKKTNPVLFFC